MENTLKNTFYEIMNHNRKSDNSSNSCNIFYIFSFSLLFSSLFSLFSLLFSSLFSLLFSSLLISLFSIFNNKSSFIFLFLSFLFNFGYIIEITFYSIKKYFSLSISN